MDFGDVNLGEPWGTWYRLGLRHLFRPKPSQEAQETHVASPSAADGEFPEPWSRILTGLHPPVPLVWTYWRLACDLGPNPDPLRRTLWAKILANCDWPQGSVAFWPMSAMDNGRIVPATSHFHNGLAVIRPSMVVCFGQRAFEALYPGTAFDYGLYESIANVPVLALPGAQDMLPDNRRAKALVWGWLQSLSQRLPALNG